MTFGLPPADGTDLAAAKLERVLTNDPAMGVIRHVDAGYPEARSAADRLHLDIPMDAPIPAPAPAPTLQGSSS